MRKSPHSQGSWAWAVLVGALALSVGALSGCETDAQTGSLLGAGIGAAAGQAIGGNTEGTLIGAGAGAVGGYIVGNERDKKANDYPKVNNN